MDLTEIVWEPTDTPGVMQSMLYQSGVGTARTALMNLQAGARIDAHAHPHESEEIFVLDGEFQDSDGSYGPGEYCFRPAGKAHRAWSKNGCIAIVIYR
jgi:anti-sigma factor ChrR (cupin superfamily)